MPVPDASEAGYAEANDSESGYAEENASESEYAETDGEESYDSDSEDEESDDYEPDEDDEDIENAQTKTVVKKPSSAPKAGKSLDKKQLKRAESRKKIRYLRARLPHRKRRMRYGLQELKDQPKRRKIRRLKRNRMQSLRK
jgi:hypothetical protein